MGNVIVSPLAIWFSQGHLAGRQHPAELIASLHLGLAKARLSSGEFDLAEMHLSNLMGQLLEGDIVPEAIVFRQIRIICPAKLDTWSVDYHPYLVTREVYTRAPLPCIFLWTQGGKMPRKIRCIN